MAISVNNYQLTSTTTNQSTSYQLWHGRGMNQGIPLRSTISMCNLYKIEGVRLSRWEPHSKPMNE